ncbi:hypothetical protein [Dyadobacter sp. 3J3]|uniref:hypothetical protein n=1 Tax=Dyadobacter sp. 3J3 TaxID=2606600 RepID=UPI001358DA49|nr:hypothetical protein [Dyadobacter sp. 3J3]
MADIIAVGFNPRKIKKPQAKKKCRRHGRYHSRGLKPTENKKTTAKKNAVGMTDIIAVGFNPRKIKNLKQRKNAVGMTDIIAVRFNPRKKRKPSNKKIPIHISEMGI